MKVAAYQAPLLASGSMQALGLIREKVEWCEAEGVEILCCPEALLGGLADYARRPADIAIDVSGGRLDALLATIASESVTTILGFTEVDASGRLYNSAAVHRQGSVIGVYRKLHPAIHHSVYDAGQEMPVFTVAGFTFGILICNDSNYGEAARVMASKGATALFVPTNNGLPPQKGGKEIVAAARAVDIARATENRVWVIRADVAGRADGLVSHGSSGIVGPDGTVRQCARQLSEDLIVTEVEVARHERLCG